MSKATTAAIRKIREQLGHIETAIDDEQRRGERSATNEVRFELAREADRMIKKLDHATNLADRFGWSSRLYQLYELAEKLGYHDQATRILKAQVERRMSFEEADALREVTL